MSGVNEFGVSVIYQNFSFDIKLLHCGFEQDPNHIMINKRIDRYTLSYITEGEGYYTIKDRYYTLNKGDVYFIPPSYVYSQRINKKNKYKYIYVSIVALARKCFYNVVGLLPIPLFSKSTTRLLKKNLGKFTNYVAKALFLLLLKPTLSSLKYFVILLKELTKITNAKSLLKANLLNARKTISKPTTSPILPLKKLLNIAIVTKVIYRKFLRIFATFL